MAKLILATPMWSDTVQALMEQIVAVPEGEDITLYQNTPGGSVFAGWALAGIMKEHQGKITIKAFGDSSSMGFYNLLYADRVEALDVTKFTIHRADGYVATPDDQILLDSINKDLQSVMKKSIDEKVFKEVTGTSFKEIFDVEKRIDVTVTAKQMKKLGIVDKIIQLDKKEIAAISKQFNAFTDIFDDSQGSDDPQGSGIKKSVDANSNSNNKNPKKMTRLEFEAQHPEMFQAILAEGHKAGIVVGQGLEKDRVGAIMAFNTIDPVAVKTAIDSGNPITETFRSEMAVKQISAMKLGDIKSDSPKPVDTKVLTPEEQKIAADEAEIVAFKKATEIAAGRTGEELNNE